jgi:type VI protein secretion system component Hcp
MVLCKSAGGPGIQGESQVIFSDKDTLLSGPPKFESGYCFALESFSMPLASPPDDSAVAKSPPPGVLVQNAAGQITASSQRRMKKGAHYQPANLNAISCTRQFDATSPTLFLECANPPGPTVFPKAAIIRRKVGGGGVQNVAQEGHLMTYIRIDFEGVQIIEVSWDSNDDGVKETFQFVCTKASVQYRQQMHTGKVNTPLPPGVWQG